MKRLAAKELRQTGTPSNTELAAELEEIADEIEESHERFVDIALQIKSRPYLGSDMEI